MNALRLVVCALALTLAAPVAAQDVGVAAAVNQAAQGTRPGAGIRTIGLGDNVIYNERIDTNDGGLVQLLLADGTTFTVGPNSSLVIDSFVYNPDAGTAQVAATLTKGVLRFIGAATSKTPDGVAITTPVGVVGIRGGVTDINMNPPAGIPPHISMIFGNSVTLTSGGELLGRLFEAGYSLAASGGSVETIKTPPDWSSQIQQALSSNPGQTGGTTNPPTNSTVADSDIAEVNSGDTTPIPPIPQPPIDRPDDLGDDLVADLPLVDLPGDHGDVFSGYGGGIVTVSDPTNPGYGVDFGLLSISTGFATDFNTIAFDANGKPVAGEMTLVVLGPNCSNACFVQIKFDPNGSTIAAIDDNFNLVVQPIHAELLDHTDVALPTGVNYCDCGFLRWGFWNLSGTATDPSNGVTAHLNVTNGTWVVAKDLSTSDELASLASTSATFNGHAIGTYSDLDTATTSALTAGDMALGWSFGTRTGTIDITDFGGRDLSGNLIGDSSFPGFIGTISDGGNADGITKGGFVNDGDTIARGVMGDFFLTDGTWTGTGIFMGTR